MVLLSEQAPELPWTDSESKLREDLSICYPDACWEEVPDSVKTSAREGDTHIATAYGEYLEKREQTRQAAAQALFRAIAQSPGLPRGGVGERLYSIDEMREMPAKEVRSRYHSLLASLGRGFEKW